MRTEPIAYEMYLVSQANKILEMNPTMTSPIEIIASMLYEDCKKVNPLAFDIVGEVVETNWTFETFEFAANEVLTRVNGLSVR